MLKQFMKCAPLGVLFGIAGCGGGTSPQSPSPTATPGGPPNTAGTTLVFVSTRDGNPEIYRMNADGSNQTRLTNNAAADTNPSINRAGTDVVFTSNRDGNSEIYKLNLASGLLVRLTTDDPAAPIAVIDRNPIFSPNGSSIAWLTQRDQTGGAAAPLNPFVMDATGANQRRASTLQAQFISWAPDSTRLAIIEGNNAQGAFVRVQTIGGGDATISDRLGNAVRDFKWSPDGAFYLFSPQTATGTEAADLRRVALATAAETSLAPAGFSTDYQASFSPDSARVAFAANSQIYVSNVATPNAAPTQLTTAGTNSEPAWAE